MNQSALFKYFPPPQFLNPKCIGLSFSDQSIKMIKFGTGNSSFPIQTLLIPLEPGIVVGGIVLKPEELSAKILENKTKFHSNFVTFTVPDELTYLFNMTLPIVVGQDVTESVASSIEENVPLTLNDTTFDFIPTSLESDGNKTEVKLLVAACVKKEVEKTISLLRAAQLEPLCGVPESSAIALAIIPKDFVGTACIAHVRVNRIALYLVKDRIVQFSTLRSVGSGEYRNEFLDEYKKLVEYWGKYDNGSRLSINTLFVCGEFECAKEVVSVAASNELKAVLANVWSNVFPVEEYTPELSYETSLVFAGAVGAAISDL